MRLTFALLGLSLSLAAASAASPASAQGAPAPLPPAAVAPAPPSYAAPYPYGPPSYGSPAYAPPSAGWAPLPPARATEPRSEGMRIAGITLFAAGGLAAVIGTGVVVAKARNPCYEADSGGALPPSPSGAALHGERIGTSRQALFADGCGTDPVFGLSLIGAGLLGAILGVPLYVIGSTRVSQRPESFALVPEVRPGARGADLRWTF